MNYPPPVLLELDPTHERHADITGAHSESASAWQRPGCFLHWGEPSTVQEEAHP